MSGICKELLQINNANSQFLKTVKRSEQAAHGRHASGQGEHGDQQHSHRGNADQNNEMSPRPYQNGCNQTIPRFREWGATGILLRCRWECKMMCSLLASIYLPKRNENTRTWTRSFTSALFTVAQMSSHGRVEKHTWCVQQQRDHSPDACRDTAQPQA